MGIRSQLISRDRGFQTSSDAAARDWLIRSRIAGTWTVTVTTDQVTVTITSAQPTQLLHLAGVAQIPVHATATAQARQPN